MDVMSCTKAVLPLCIVVLLLRLYEANVQHVLRDGKRSHREMPLYAALPQRGTAFMLMDQ